MFIGLGVIAKFDGNIFAVREIYTRKEALIIEDELGFSYKVAFESIYCADKALETFWKYCRVGKRYFDFDKMNKHGGIENGFVC